MSIKLTRFHRHHLDRVQRFRNASGWELQEFVDAEPNRNCVSVPTDVFFPAADEETGDAIRKQERARIERECAGCPVADECLAGALLRGERYGSWGGVAQPDFQTLGRLFRSQQRHDAAEQNEEAA